MYHQALFIGEVKIMYSFDRYDSCDTPVLFEEAALDIADSFSTMQLHICERLDVSDLWLTNPVL